MIIIKEDKSENYAPRTYFNAKSASVTMALAVNLGTRGEMLTHNAAGERYIGFLLTDDSSAFDIAHQVMAFMKKRGGKTLNIAGNGIYTLREYGCSQEHMNAFVCDIVEIIQHNMGIEKIYTGGQTGVDLAGAVAANYLGIDALITLPKGFKQRFEDNRDRIQTLEDIQAQVEHWTQILRNNDQILAQQTQARKMTP